MALISCPNPQCIYEVSSKAVACLRCGTPVMTFSDFKTIASSEDLIRVAGEAKSLPRGTKLLVVGELSQQISKAYNQLHKSDSKVKQGFIGASVAAVALLAVLNGQKVEGLGFGVMGGMTTLATFTDSEKATATLPNMEAIILLYQAGFLLISNMSQMVILRNKGNSGLPGLVDKMRGIG